MSTKVAREKKAIVQTAAKMADKVSSNPEKNKKRSKKALRGEGASRFLKALNPYYLTVKDPFRVRGVRIPDLVTTPSTAFSLEYHGTVSTSTTFGCFGIAIGASFTPAHFADLVPQQCNNYVLGSVSWSDATTSALFGTTPVEFAYQNWNSASGYQVPALFQQVRLVSMGLNVVPLSAPLNLKGQMGAAFYPRMNNLTRGQTTLAWANFAQAPDFLMVPVNQGNGVSVVYRPMDSISTQYSSCDFPVSGGGGEPLSAVGGTLMVCGTGLNPGDAVQFTLVANYEGIPRTNLLDLIPAEPSISDPLSLSGAFNALEDTPIVRANSKDLQESNLGPTSGMTQTGHRIHDEVTVVKEKEAKSEPLLSQKKSLFERVIETALPIVGKVAPKLLSLLD